MRARCEFARRETRRTRPNGKTGTAVARDRLFFHKGNKLRARARLAVKRSKPRPFETRRNAFRGPLDRNVHATRTPEAENSTAAVAVNRMSFSRPLPSFVARRALNSHTRKSNRASYVRFAKITPRCVVPASSAPFVATSLNARRSSIYSPFSLARSLALFTIPIIYL